MITRWTNQNVELPRRGAKEGGIERFEIVKASMSPGDMLARSGAPFYSGNDKSQKITPETIAFFKRPASSTSSASTATPTPRT